MRNFSLVEFRNTRLPSEAEIISSWHGDTKKPVVSVICITYNQEKYIEDAIRGFLTQKTNFPFEIIIHDDASTDATARIIKKYQGEYKNIIKPIFQSENQYSKSPNSVVLIASKVAAGDYLAFCEGDDFWINENKIQMQVDALRANPKINICFHKYLMGNPEANKGVFNEPMVIRLLYPWRKKIFSTAQMIIAGGGFMPTASIMIKKDIKNNLPAWYLNCPVGDYFTQIMGTVESGALYLPWSMSFYRVSAIGSWTEINKSPNNRYAITLKLEASMADIDNELSGRYRKEISLIKKYYWIDYLQFIENLQFIKKTESKTAKEQLALVSRLPVKQAALIFRMKKIYLQLIVAYKLIVSS